MRLCNPDLKLKPGMTANVSVEIARRTNVLRIPAAALRFRPTADHFTALNLPVPPEIANRGAGLAGGRGRDGGRGGGGGTGPGGTGGRAAGGGGGAAARVVRAPAHRAAVVRRPAHRAPRRRRHRRRRRSRR